MVLSKNLRFGRRAKKYIPYLMENLRVYRGEGKNLFEFYPSSMLKVIHFPKEEEEILGIAYGYKDALLLVAEMALEKVRREGEW